MLDILTARAAPDMGRSIAPRESGLDFPVRMLLALLRPASPQATGSADSRLAAESWPGILEVARLHGVSPLLHRALQSQGRLAGVPPAIQACLREDRRANALANLRNYGEFKRIAAALSTQGVPVMALKGLHLAELVYRDISLRPMGDMDILVPRGQVGDAMDVLRRMEYGFDADTRGNAVRLLDTKCNVGLHHRHLDVWLEVHWSLGEPPNRYVAAIANIWSRAAPGSLGDAAVALMPAEFVLLHVCAHLSCNHGFAFSLRALCDIAEILRSNPIDWDIVVEHGRLCGWQRGVAASLRLANDHLAAGVPPNVLAALGADVLAEDMLQDAIRHLTACVQMPSALHTAPNLMAVAGSKRPIRSAVLLAKRILAPKAEVALAYGLAERSPRLPFYYAVRAKDLFRRYAPAAWRLFVSDRELRQTAGRHVRLANWINGE